MATNELRLRGGEAPVKARDPLAVAVLSIVTLGIYFFVWWYKIHRELRDYGHSRDYDLGQDPTTSTLAVTLGALIIVPALVSLFHGTQRVQSAQRLAGIENVLNGWIALICYLLLFPAFVAYLQSQLNHVWKVEAEPVSGTVAPPKPGGQMPPQVGGTGEPGSA